MLHGIDSISIDPEQGRIDGGRLAEDGQVAEEGSVRASCCKFHQQRFCAVIPRQRCLGHGEHDRIVGSDERVGRGQKHRRRYGRRVGRVSGR